MTSIFSKGEEIKNVDPSEVMSIAKVISIHFLVT